MIPTTRRTTDHERIRRWAEERGGAPAIVTAPGANGAAAPGLRIHFPSRPANGHEARTVSWEEFFERFEHARLAFVFREEAAAGGTSRFCQLVERE